MKEMILLFNPPAKEQLLKIRSALLPLHIRIQLIKPEQYNQPLGYLAGMKDISPVEGNYAGEELPDTMFLFSSLSSSRLDQVLAALRKSGAGPFPYKAVLTATNSKWNASTRFVANMKHSILKTLFSNQSGRLPILL